MMVRGIFIGIVVTLLTLGAGGYLVLVSGLIPTNADAEPPAFEKWAAHVSMHASMSKIAQASNPLTNNDQNLVAAVKLYGANCAVCHGLADGEPTNITKGLYQMPPLFAKDGVEDDPESRSHSVIAHGIRLTGMPAYARTLSDKEIWQLALFLKHMDNLPLKAAQAWKNLGK